MNTADIDETLAILDGLTLKRIQEVSRLRCRRWHHDDTVPWTGADWSNAMCGEAGEAANVVKKIRRLETGTVGGHNRPRQTWLDRLLRRPPRDQYTVLIDKLLEELADTLLYAVLVAEHYSSDPHALTRAVVRKFNLVSVESGFPERLP